jgi:DNA primase
MKRDIAEMKRRLPLPTLMDWLGLGEYAQTSAKCPFHEDSRASFSVYETPKGWLWKCHASCGGGDEVTLLERVENLSRTDAIARFGQLVST